MAHHNGTEEPGGADEVATARDALGGRHVPLDVRSTTRMPGRGHASDRAVPNLPSRDFDKTIAFYGAFGFEVSYRAGGWLIIRRAALDLEFFLVPEHDPSSSSFMASIRVIDLDELYAAIRAAGVIEATRGFPRLVPVALQDWGGRAGFLIDEDGTQLHLIEDSP